MKKFASLLLAVVLLATMLTVFAVPASAEETKTAEEYLNDASNYAMNGQYGDAAETYMKAGECYEKAKHFFKAGVAFYNAAGQYAFTGDNAAIAYAYMKAGECYLKNGDFSNAGDYFSNAAEAARRKANESTGSTLSEGSLTIIVGVAAFVLGSGVMFFIMKKKKPAVASGENKDEE